MKAFLVVLMLSLALSSSSVFATSANQLPMDRFADTGHHDGSIFHLWDLASAKPKNYSKIFAASIEPNPKNFRGHRYNGVILYVNDWGPGKTIFTQYTGKNVDLLTNKLYAQPLTFQKRFFDHDNERGESGVNFWPVRQAEAMPMKIYNSEGSMKIDYDVAANHPISERPLLDEIRQIPGSDLYIGKMYYRMAGKRILFLWFALEKAE